MKATITTVILLLGAMPLLAHRLDEYLQATIVSVEKGRVGVQMLLTPGVAVFPQILAEIDADSDGALSEAERHAYVTHVLADLSASIDGHRLTPRLTSAKFPEIGEMRDGRGEIQLDFAIDLPPGGSKRKFVIENRHASRIAAYQVNCLVPRDPDIRIVAQKRNFTQSYYELDYTQNGAGTNILSAWWLPARGRILTGLLVVLAWAALWWRRGD